MSKADFNWFEKLDALLSEQDEANAAQKQWAEIDAMKDVGDIAIGKVDVPPNAYL